MIERDIHRDLRFEVVTDNGDPVAAFNLHVSFDVVPGCRGVSGPVPLPPEPAHIINLSAVLTDEKGEVIDDVRKWLTAAVMPTDEALWELTG